MEQVSKNSKLATQKEVKLEKEAQNETENLELENTQDEDNDWNRLTITQFFKGYNESDDIYNNL